MTELALLWIAKALQATAVVGLVVVLIALVYVNLRRSK